MTSLDIIRLNRSEGIGSSDAKRVMEGDWHALYMEKVGLTEPVDLSDVFKVQLGILTERFHVEWQARRNGVTISYPEVRFYHPDYAFMFAHLDGWIDTFGTFIEAKHTRGGASIRETAIYYMPQLQHVMAIKNVDRCYFSIIAGNEEPEWGVIDRNQEYIERLIAMEESFWWHVRNRVPPEITPTGTQAEVKKIAAATVIDGLRAYDMTANNQWASLAIDYTETKAAAARFEEAKKGIKELVPADAAEAVGHGITVKRDKRGALRFS